MPSYHIPVRHCNIIPQSTHRFCKFRSPNHISVYFYYLPYTSLIRGSNPSMDKGFTLMKISRLAPGSTQPPIQWVQRVVSQGKGVGHEADNSPTCSVEVYECSFTSLPSICLHGVCGNNFMFLTCSVRLMMHNLITIIILCLWFRAS